MAAAYLKKNVDEYEGLVLLGSYATADLSDTDLQVLSIYGNETCKCKNKHLQVFLGLQA